MKTIILLTLLLSSLVNAQSKVVPIFDMKSGGLLGGVQDGRFVDAATASKSVKVGDNLLRFGLNGAEKRLTTVSKFDYLEVCRAYHLGLEPRSDSGIAVGEGAVWNLSPRVPTSINLTNKTYTKIVADYLREESFPNPEVKITQAVRIDLDGDGTEEVVLAATRETGVEGLGYSFILVRKIVGKTVQNILVEGEFYPKDQNAGPSNPEVLTFEISAIADLNGDGKTEIVTNSVAQNYDGGGSSVFEIVGANAVPVEPLAVGCGFF